MILLLQYTLIFASVLILVALGGCFAEHSGVINLGLEGIMIMGALGGALTMRYVPNTAPAIVMLLAVIVVSALVGMVYSCLLAVASINFKADQTLVGTALNLLGTAGATVIVKAINTAANPDDVSSIVQYGGAKSALLVSIGSFEFNWFMLVAFIALVFAYVTLYKTRFGLRLMACGEHPQAAASVGINVYKMRWAGVLISGVLGGIGGIVFITAGAVSSPTVPTATSARTRPSRVQSLPRCWHSSPTRRARRTTSPTSPRTTGQPMRSLSARSSAGSTAIPTAPSARIRP